MDCRWAFLLALIMTFSMLAAETLTYREVEGSLVTIHTIAVTPAPPGYRVELTSQRAGAHAVHQTFRTAADNSTLEWTFSDPARRMELAAAVQGDNIVLTGSFQGKNVAKKFATAGAQWNQLFQMGLGPFVLSARESIQFRSIGTQGPGELKTGKMTVTRKADEAIDLAGTDVVAVHLRISLSGLLSVFWHGDYWYRKNDGRFLRYRGKNRSGGPVAVSELVKEEPNGTR